jgi:hypothetical protein
MRYERIREEEDESRRILLFRLSLHAADDQYIHSKLTFQNVMNWKNLNAKKTALPDVEAVRFSKGYR